MNALMAQVKRIWDELQALKARVNRISTPDGQLRFDGDSFVGLLPIHTHQGTGGGGTLDHGLALTGLGDDDHPPYLKADGTRNLTGNLAVDAGITIDGVDIGDHSARHENGGADEISVAGLSGALADGQNAIQLQGRNVAAAAPANTNVLAWNDGASQWEPTAAGSPGAHASSHQNAGGDEISVSGLSGLLADGQTPVNHDHTGDAGDGGLLPFRLVAPPAIADVSVSGFTISLTAAENVVFGDMCYINASGKLAKADADAIATGWVIVMAAATISADAVGLFLIPFPIARNDAWNWTPGVTLYLDTATAGGLTATAPSGTDDVILAVAQALTADIIVFAPSRTPVEHT